MLPADTMAQLAADYRHASAEWRTAPRPAAVRARQAKLAAALAKASEELDQLPNDEAALSGLSDSEITGMVATLDGMAGRAEGAVADLDRRGAGLGGARRLGALYELPPRARLLLAIRIAYAKQARP